VRQKKLVVVATFIVISKAAGVFQFIHKQKFTSMSQHATCTTYLHERFVFFFSRQKISSSALMRGKKQQSYNLLQNCNQQRNLRGELERRVRDPVGNSFLIFCMIFSNICQESDFT